MVGLSDLRLREACARIARLTSLPLVSAELGSIVLRDDQRSAAARVAAAMSRDGGCVLADDVGRGKTYVALAIARAWGAPLFIIPASLRAVWVDAMGRTGVSGRLVSHEALSRGGMVSGTFDGAVVDESHRFRAVDAKRYSALARLTSRVPLLLLSATPLQNGASDLRAQLALFLGERAWYLEEEDLARHVVRGSSTGVPALPRVAPPRWVTPAADDGDVLRAILALPPPPRPTDGGDAGLLRTIALVRAWASSRAALRSMLRRRGQTAAAFEQSVSVGRVPARRELRSWRGEGGDVQLGFASLLVSLSRSASELAPIADVAELERDALAAVECAMRSGADPDVARVDALRVIRSEHAGERILAFSEYASTVRGYFAAMRNEVGVGMLTAQDARIASGRLSRAALLERFAPRALGAPEPPERERVSLLLTTDLLSEGMNLQDASVVVHLDLPWNPARLAQRVGRVRRPGGAVVVHSYLMSPPAQSRLLLDVERRLRRKIEGAERAVGRGVAVVPWLSGESAGALACPRDAVVPDRPLSAEDRGEIAARVAAWARRRRAARGSFGPHCPPFIAAACGPSRLWLAMLSNGQMVAAVGGAAPDDDGSVLRAVVSMGASGRPTRELEVGDALRALEQWLRDEAVRRACGVDVPNTPLQVAVQRRTSEILTRAPRHERIRLAVLARQLRSALQRTRPLGAEWQLAAMLEAPVNGNADADWLMRACEIARRAPGTGTGDASDRCEVSVVVLICVARDDCERVLIASPEAVSQPLE